MEDRVAWPIRAPLLATIGAITGLCVNLLVDIGHAGWTDNTARVAAATFLFGTSMSFGLVAERRRLSWAVAFAVTSGAIVGLVAWWTDAWGSRPDIEFWHLVCAGLALAIAAPLFQVARDEEGLRFPYVAVHRHAWTNVVLWCAGWAFAGATWLLAWLLASLFDLIGIDALQKLLGKGWFDCMLIGAALGAAIGILRERDKIAATLQKVATAVFGVLAPVLAAGLLIFLLLLPMRGISLLWDATKYTTPILITCVASALVLANAVLGDADEDDARSPILNWGAMGLGLAMLPLTLIAAVSTAKRIHQYGLSPDRLWAVTFVAIATAYALAYLVALARGRQDWGDHVRRANLTLAFGVCGVALLLATPLAAFGALSAQDQMARIRDGRTSPGRIDYRAFAFDMGKAGRRALENLKSNGPTADIRQRAGKALSAKDRWEVDNPQVGATPELLRAKTQVFPAGAEVPPQLWAAIPSYDACASPDRAGTHCVIRLWGDRNMAAVIALDCRGSDCEVQSRILYRHRDGGWSATRETYEDRQARTLNADPATSRADVERQWAAARKGDITIRPVTTEQLFVGEQQTGDGIDPPVSAPKP